MAERQVTVDGETYQLPDPFHVVATSNPVEYEGTYPLPEAQLDRFMVRVAVGYPERDAEVDVLARRLARRQEMGSVRTVVDAATLRAMQAGVEAVTVDTDILRYCVDLAAATRAHDAVEVGASPRGSQALVLVARSLAVLSGRDFVTPEDVKAVAVPALAHRLSLTPQAWATGAAPQGSSPTCWRGSRVRRRRDAYDLGALARDGRRGRRRPRRSWCVGALLGRPDVAVLGAAPLIAGVRDWRRRPSVDPTVRLEASDAAAGRGDAARRRRGRRPPRPCCSGSVAVPRVLLEAWVRVDGTRHLPLVVHTVRTGPQEVALVDVQGVGPGAASVSEPSPSAVPLRPGAARPASARRPAAAAAAARADRRPRVPTARRGRRAARRAPVRARRPAAADRLARHRAAGP